MSHVLDVSRQVVLKPQISNFKNLTSCFLKISSNLKIKARHMYEMKHYSIVLNTNYQYYKDASVKKKATLQINSCDAKINIFSGRLGEKG